MAQKRQARDDTALSRGTNRALDRFKYDVAREMKVNIPEDHYWGNVSSAQCGKVGGHMVRKMIEMAEINLMNRAPTRHRR